MSMLTWRDVQQIVALALCASGLIVCALKIRRRPAAWRKWVPFIVAMAVNALFYVAVIFDARDRLANDLSPARSLITIAMIFVYGMLMPAVATDEH